MASAPTLAPSNKKTTNYARLCRLLVDGGAKALRYAFDNFHSPANLFNVLKAGSAEHSTLQSLRKKRIINANQWGKLYPSPPSSVTSEGFDITLLMVLLRNICGLSAPATGWDSLPPTSDTSVEANIARVKYYRNSAYGHASQASVEDLTFNTLWQNITAALVALGVDAASVNRLKTESIDPDVETHYRGLLKEWKEDEDNIKDQLDRMEGKLRKQMKSEMGKMSEKLEAMTNSATEDGDKIREQMRSEMKNISEKITEEGDRTRKDLRQMESDISETLKTLVSATKEEVGLVVGHIENIRVQYKRHEGWLAPFPWCDHFSFPLKNIYTPLRMVSREKKARATAEQRVVKTTEIFKPHEECEKPRKVLIEGKPGMEKTTYCNKVAYDWATKELEAGEYFPEFELVLWLKCCDVGIGSDLWDAIDDQLLPGEIQKEQKEKFFNFISQNQSKVLLVLDGLDEMPTSKLPKTFSEVISGKTLSGCYLVVTARHEAGIPVRKDCDTLLEVEGFSPEDAKEFILKYFEGKEDMAHALIDKMSIDSRLEELTYFEGRGDVAHDLLANSSIDSRPGMLTANPLNTALLCLLFEDFEGKLPQSRTQLYSEIVQCVLIRYRKKKGLLVDKTDLMELYKGQLEQLGLIALNSLREGTTHFEDKQLGSEHSDLTEFGFLSVQPGRSKRRPCFRYGFTHKSFQEFFAGYYLCCQLVSEEISPEVLVTAKRNFRELIQVLQFTCGLLAVQNEERLQAMIESIADKVNKEDTKESLLVALEIIKDLPFKVALRFGSCLKVQEVDLSGERIEIDLAAKLFGVLITNKTLTHLVLTQNELGNAPFHFSLFAKVLGTNKSLTTLNLTDNELCKAGFESLAAALGKNATLTSLDLTHNAPSHAGVNSLAAALETNRSLKDLNLSWNDLDPASADSLAASLTRNTTLTKLDLSCNRLGNSPLLFKTKTALTKLVLTGNDLGPSTAESIGAALARNTTLTFLDLCVNNLGPAGAASLATALKTNTTLTKLYLSHNNLGCSGAESLAAALKTNTTVTELNLSKNNLGLGGAESLADALKTNTALTKLALQFNNLDPASAESLAAGFKTNTSLKELNLSHNALTDVTSLAAALETNRSLKDLNLSWNNLCPVSADSLAASLTTNTTLTKLDLSGNNLGPAGGESLATALETNTTLKYLFLFENNISEAGRKKLNEAHGDRILFKCVDPYYSACITYSEALQNTQPIEIAWECLDEIP